MVSHDIHDVHSLLVVGGRLTVCFSRRKKQCQSESAPGNGNLCNVVRISILCCPQTSVSRQSLRQIGDHNEADDSNEQSSEEVFEIESHVVKLVVGERLSSFDADISQEAADQKDEDQEPDSD